MKEINTLHPAHLEAMATCVICLESHEEDSALSTDLFIGDCNCSYRTHKQCIGKWLVTKNSQNIKCINCGSNVRLRDEFKSLASKPQDTCRCCSPEYMYAGLLYICLSVLIYFLAYVWCISIKSRS